MAQPRDSRGRFASTGGAALAITAAVAVAFSGSGAAGSSAIGSGGGTTARSGSSSSSGQARAREGDVRRVVQRLDRVADQVDRITSAGGADCAAHATGRVREFFEEHPCSALHRALFEIRDGRRGVVRVAVASVDMPDAELAREYQELIDSPGTGTVRPLTRDGRRDDTGFDGVAYESARDGVTVVIAQAEPVGRTARAVELAEIAVGTATSG